MGELQGLGPPLTPPPSSSPGSSPVAAAALPAQEKRRGRRMSGDGTRDGGDTLWGPAASQAGACSSTGHFSIRVQTGQFCTFYIFLVLYIIVTDLNFVYFVKKTGVLSGFFSLPLILSLPALRWARGMRVVLPGWRYHRCPCQRLARQRDTSGSNT